MTNVMNDTLVGLNAMNMVSDSSFWIMFLLTFLCIIIIIFMCFYFFRLFLLGGVFTGILVFIGYLSFRVSEQYVRGNNVPLYFTWFAFGFVIVSLIVGLFVSKTGWYRKFEKDYLKEEKENG